MGIDNTADRIVLSALNTLLRQGVKRTGLEDVAYEAGVTRITIYRYFGDKQGLVRAVCRHLAGVFRRAAAGNPDDSTLDIDGRLKRLSEELAQLPPGNLGARLDEIRRLYPEVHEELRAARENSLDQLFDQAVAAAAREGSLREEINLQVVKAMFRASVVGLIENPALVVANVSTAEICQTVTAVLRHGMLKDDGRTARERPAARETEHATY